jgi:hypothetical protein
MANKRISSLTALGGTPDDTDIIPITDVSDTTGSAQGTTKKVTVANLMSAGIFSDIVSETTTARTLSDSDCGKVIDCSNGSAVTITIPSTVSAGFNCTVVQSGAGQVTIAAGASVNLYCYSSAKATAGQYASINIIPYASNSYVLEGDLAASGGGGGGGALQNDYSLNFDGTNSWLDIGDISSLTASQANLSLSYWINETSSTAHQGHLGNQSGLTGAIGFFSSYYYYGHWKTGAEVQIVNPRPTTGVWHNIIVTMNNSYIKVFVDKVLKYYDTTSGSTSSSLYNDFNIGKERNNVYGRNKIDEVAFFQSTLSDGSVTSTGSTATGDVADIYNSGVPTDLSSYSPVGWWRMGDNETGVSDGSATPTTITDQGVTYDPSANGGSGGYVASGNDGTLTNGPTYSTDTP